MKIIFLDIDGVLNTAEGWFHYDRAGEKKEDIEFDNMARLDPRACANLDYVLKRMPEVRIVVHSSWRKVMDFKDLVRMLSAYGACAPEVIIGITDRRLSKEGGIQEFIKANGVTHYAVLEDTELKVPPENLILVSHPYTGFTVVDAFRTLDALGNTESHPCFLF